MQPPPVALVPQAPPQARTKPLLRGVSHQIAAFVTVPAAAALVAGARGSARSAAITYGLSLLTLFAVSATYHRPMWSLRARRVLWRLDHAAIFFLIAGTYTPICLLMGGTGRALLALAWATAAIGIAISLFWVTAPKRLMAAIYVAFGWMGAPAFPALVATVGGSAIALLLGGGMLYSVGALIYALRRPDPFPTVFGFHEIFHLLVVAAAACHFVVVALALRVLS